MNNPPKSYRWHAEAYAQHSRSQFMWAEELIEKLNLSGNESVLDIGCGDGKVTAAIAAQLPSGRVIGIDNSKEMLALARKRHGGERANIDFQLLDIRELSERGGFDVIFSNAALHWIKNHPPILNRIANALKTCGRLLLQMGGKGNAQQVIDVVNRLINEKWKDYFINFDFPYGFHSPEEYTGWLLNAGLKPHRVELIGKDMCHNGRNEMAGWIKTTWLPYLERVPSSRREMFVDAIVDTYVRTYPPDNDGTFHVPMKRLEVEATKIM